MPPTTEHDLLRVLRSVTPASLQDAFEHAPVMVTVTRGPDHRLVWRNRLAVEGYGPVEEDLPLVEVFPEAVGVLAEWDRAYCGHVVTPPSRTVSVHDVEGRRRVMRYTLAPLQDRTGSVMGVIQFVRDATEEADARREAAHSRIQAHVADATSHAPGPLLAVQALTDALVPGMADLAAVYAYPEPGGRAATGEPTPPPVALSLTERLQQLGPPPPPARSERRSPWDDALDSGEALYIPVDDSTLEHVAPTPEARAWLQAAGGRHLAVAPLIVAGNVVGGLLLMASDDRPGYDDRDLCLVRELTRTAGAAIAEVRARERHRRTAERLQHALLPSRPVQPSGLAVAARYVPNGTENPVGGDWWDVLDLGDGRAGIGIGDISGHGISAAALMGQARVAMRTAGHILLSPAQVLEIVDARLVEAIEQQSEEKSSDLHRFATALYGIADRNCHTLRLASAGHLPLLLRSPAGAIRPVWPPIGPPLGLGLAGYEEMSLPFGPGDVAVAFTDGLVEDRSSPVFDGIDRLAAVLGGTPSAEPEKLADVLLEEMGRLHRGNDDDIALLVIAVTG